MRVAVLIVIGVATCFLSTIARANESGEALRDDGAESARARPVDIAATGPFLALTNTASVERWRTNVIGLAGYDSARGSGIFEAAAEVRLWGPVTVRGGAVYVNADNTLRPSFGGRLQALRQSRHGVDGAVGVLYRPEGLTEPEGEIEGVVSVGKHLGQTYLLGNLLYGQDPEANERDGEVRLAALRPIGASSRFVVGFDSRLRFDLGSDPAKLAQHHEATMDALVGPVASVMIGPAAISLQTGGSTRRLAGATSYGAFVMTGIGFVR